MYSSIFYLCSKTYFLFLYIIIFKRRRLQTFYDLIFSLIHVWLFLGIAQFQIYYIFIIIEQCSCIGDTDRAQTQTHIQFRDSNKNLLSIKVMYLSYVDVCICVLRFERTYNFPSFSWIFYLFLCHFNTLWALQIHQWRNQLNKQTNKQTNSKPSLMHFIIIIITITTECEHVCGLWYNKTYKT